MDILIPDSWLREYLETNAKPKQIQEALSLCGPSVERLHKKNGDYVYGIEITTNRPDSMSVIGLALECVAILPRFGYRARLKKNPYAKKTILSTKSKVSYLDVKINKNLATRFSAVLIKDVRVGKSPIDVIKKLELVGLRGLNNIVDISNYLMIEMGQPVHVFDYDKIADHKMNLRESRVGEKITTLDHKEHTLPGGDIVIEDGSGELIDLCGIMGGLNSSVDENTKNVLLFVQIYEPNHIRRTSMKLAHRTDAATLFEKGLPTENVLPTMKMGIEMLSRLANGKATPHILDVLNKPEKLTYVKFLTPIDEFVSKRIGVDIKYPEIVKILKSLEIIVKSKFLVEIPWRRKHDITIPEDVVEEVARIYGYHNLPSEIMTGRLPEPLLDTPFAFENKIKNILKGYSGVEVYTSSLVSKEFAGEDALALQNPLGDDTKYLRTSLQPSLVSASNENTTEKDAFFLYEVANVYLRDSSAAVGMTKLPNEVMTLGIIFSNFDYRKAKGIIEALFEELNIRDTSTTLSMTKDEGMYFENPVQELRSKANPNPTYVSIQKYPAQIEDLTFTLPINTKVGNVINEVLNVMLQVTNVELRDIYKNDYTFRIWYQDKKKTLTDKEVEKIREKIIKIVGEKFGGSFKASGL